MTLEEIGRVMGLTRERVRQIEQQALAKIRKQLGIHPDQEIEIEGMKKLLPPISVPRIDFDELEREIEKRQSQRKTE